jgi:cell division septation protein DedD
MNQYGQRKGAGNPDKKTSKAILMIFMGMFAGLLIAVGVAFYISNMPIPFIKQDTPVDDTLVEQIQDDPLPLIGGRGSDGLIVQSDPFGGHEEFIEAGTELSMETTVKPADDTVAPLQAKPIVDPLMDEEKKPSEDPKTSSDAKPVNRDAKPVNPPQNQYDFYNVLPKESDTVKSTPTTPAQTGDKPKAERYYLQAGAFKSAQDADNLKASLALMGVEAGIQTIIGSENTSIHRVRIGPISSKTDAEAIQKRLTGNKVSTDIIKVTP